MRFEWEDEDYGFHECTLYDGDKKIDDICFLDYTSEFHQRDDKEYRYERPYAFVVSWCHGWSMEQGFDYDKDYNKHWDEDALKENGWYVPTGSYQGNCTHTVDDIKRWCEEWLAQRYIKRYKDILAEIDTVKSRAEWFEKNGYGKVDLKNEEDN